MDLGTLKVVVTLKNVYLMNVIYKFNFKVEWLRLGLDKLSSWGQNTLQSWMISTKVQKP